MSDVPGTHEIWVALAELFFLDTEPGEGEYVDVAAMLRRAGWSAEETRAALMAMAPVAGANLGYMVYPVLGEWAGFDRAALCGAIEARLARRQGRPDWLYYWQYRHARWMLRQLDVDRLLRMI